VNIWCAMGKWTSLRRPEADRYLPRHPSVMPG
jgi:hypothetical protein